MIAAGKGREKIVSFLLSCGADTNLADKLGATPLHRSVSATEIFLEKLEIFSELPGRVTAGW